MGKKKRVQKQQPAQPSAESLNIEKQRRDLRDFDASARGWLIAVVLGVTFLAFSNSIFNGFAYDDTTQILGNPFIQDLRNAPTALVTEAWYWRTQEDQDPNQQAKPSTPYYRPGVIIYMMFGWAMFGDWATGWHLANVLMHLLSVLFAFILLEKVTKDLRLTTLATLLFAIHPMRSETVAWISGMTDLLLALFLLPSFYLYLRYRESKDRKHLFGALGLFLLAAFTKEPAICLPMFIAAYEVLIANQEVPLRERIKSAIKYSAVFLMISAVYFGMRQYSLGFLLNDINYVSHGTVGVILTIPIVICKYIGLLFGGLVALPLDLLAALEIPVPRVNFSLFHSTTIVNTPLSLRFILPVVGLAALGYGLWRLRGSMLVRFGALWFFIHLLPVLNLSAFAVDFLVQERYVYIPSLGFSLLVAMALLRLPVDEWIEVGGRRTAQLATAALMIILLTGKTFAQNEMWKDDLALWESGARAAEGQKMALFILGHKYVKLQQYDKTIKTFEEYLKQDQDNVVVLHNLASSYLLQYQAEARMNQATANINHLYRVIELCKRGIDLPYAMGSFWDTLGSAYTFNNELRDLNYAYVCYQNGLKKDPKNAMLHMHMGTIMLQNELEWEQHQGGAAQPNPGLHAMHRCMYDMAIQYLDRARQIQPDLPDTYRLLGKIYKQRGETELAIKNFETYLYLQPDSLDSELVRKEAQQLRAALEAKAPNS
jgi:tetratricopeptide (TPR) repeat protein